MQYLTFLLAGEEYGIDILRVQEINGWDHATRIPQAPPYVLGVMNLRGTVVPIVDLRRRFGMESVPFGPTTVVIVLRTEAARRQQTVGVVVDAVSEVYDIDAQSLEAPPDLCGRAESIFVMGLAAVDRKLLLILDVDRLVGGSIARDLTPEAAEA